MGGRDLAAAAAAEIKGNQSTSTKERNGMEARGRGDREGLALDCFEGGARATQAKRGEKKEREPGSQQHHQEMREKGLSLSSLWRFWRRERTSSCCCFPLFAHFCFLPW